MLPLRIPIQTPTAAAPVEPSPRRNVQRDETLLPIGLNMPTLLLMRHAKSDWSDVDLPDHDRPLNDRGKRDAPRMGRWLAEQGLAPSFILTSSAKRAQKTAERVVRELGCDVYVEVRGELYLADVEQWLAVLAELPADAECVLCVGHNPGLEALLVRLTGQCEPMPTAAIAYLDVRVTDWAQLPTAPEKFRLQALWRPKELSAGN